VAPTATRRAVGRDYILILWVGHAPSFSCWWSAIAACASVSIFFSSSSRYPSWRFSWPMTPFLAASRKMRNGDSGKGGGVSGFKWGSLQCWMTQRSFSSKDSSLPERDDGGSREAFISSLSTLSFSLNRTTSDWYTHTATSVGAIREPPLQIQAKTKLKKRNQSGSKNFLRTWGQECFSLSFPHMLGGMEG